MYTPLYVVDAHIQDVNTNRLQQARRAELTRPEQQGQRAPIGRYIAGLRQVSGHRLVSVGQWLQRPPAGRVAHELEAMSVTRSQASSFCR